MPFWQLVGSSWSRSCFVCQQSRKLVIENPIYSNLWLCFLHTAPCLCSAWMNLLTVWNTFHSSICSIFFWNNLGISLCFLKFCRYVLSLFLSSLERPLHVIYPTAWNDNVFLAIVILLSVHIEMCLSCTPEHYIPIIVYRWLKSWITWQLHVWLWSIKQHGFKWYCTEKHRRNSKEIWIG